MIPAIILDTETTGFEEPEVIELAWQVWPCETKDVNLFHFKPSKVIEWGALATHHILQSSLDSTPLPSSRAWEALPPASYLIGHNVDYDWKALGCPEGKRICTQAMARAVWPKLDSHKLGALIYFAFGASESTRAIVKGAHSAGDDVWMCKMLLEVIISTAKIDDDLEALYLFSEECRIPKVMAFGKYKGEPISAVDRGYMNWYRRQPDTDPYVLEAFRRNGM